MNKIMLTLAALAMCATGAMAHGDGHHHHQDVHHHDHHQPVDGHTYAIEIKNVGGSQATLVNDRLTLHGHVAESEWMKREGFGEGKLETDDEEFDATFTKGEETVRFRGDLEHGVIHGKIKKSVRHEGGHVHWIFQGRAEEAHAAPAGAAKSLFERLGGEPALTAVVGTFVDGLVADPTLNANPVIHARFAKADAALLKKQLVEFVGKATGGDLNYTGRDMVTIHKDMSIGEKDWAAMAAVFVKTLNQYKVPKAEQDELLAIVGTTKKDIVTKP